MSPAVRSLVAALALAGAAACSTTDQPITAPPDHPPDAAAAHGLPDAVARARHERLARRVATALRDDDFRREVHAAIAASPFPERKVHLQAFLDGRGGAARRRLAVLSSEPDSAVANDLTASPSLELYFPVAAHRARWAGGLDLLVATAERESEAPVAFDTRGGRHRLDPDRAPHTPVLMVSRAEVDFAAAPAGAGCVFMCDGGDSGGNTGGGSGGSIPPGLYLTKTAFVDDFEGWFKGDPEFEIHVLGNDGGTSRLRTWQCAGATAGGPYAFDQNTTTWSGRVMLFSQAQLDQYRQQHPGQGVRILVVEDDDTGCEIKVDSTRATQLFSAVDALYRGYAGGRDTTYALARYFRQWPMWRRVISAVASFIKSNDELVGNAVEDVAAASAFLSGANWIVRNETTAAQGALALEMR